jgi:hypothetical protein
MIPALALSGLPMLLGVGALALAMFKDVIRVPFKFPEHRAKNPKEVTMMTDKQKKRLPKYARDAIDRLEAALTEANAAHSTAVEKGTAEIRRLEEKCRRLSEAVQRASDGDPGEIRINRSFDGRFSARVRVAADFKAALGNITARAKTPQAALSAVLRALGRAALDLPSMTAMSRTWYADTDTIAAEKGKPT